MNKHEKKQKELSRLARQRSQDLGLLPPTLAKKVVVIDGHHYLRVK